MIVEINAGTESVRASAIECFLERLCTLERVAKTRLTRFDRLGLRVGDTYSKSVNRAIRRAAKLVEWHEFRLHDGALAIHYKLRAEGAPRTDILAHLVRSPYDYDQVRRAVVKVAAEIYPTLHIRLMYDAWLNDLRWTPTTVSEMHARADEIVRASGNAFLADEIREAFPKDKSSSVADFVRHVNEKDHYARILRAYLDV